MLPVPAYVNQSYVAVEGKTDRHVEIQCHQAIEGAWVETHGQESQQNFLRVRLKEGGLCSRQCKIISISVGKYLVCVKIISKMSAHSWL